MRKIRKVEIPEVDQRRYLEAVLGKRIIVDAPINDIDETDEAQDQADHDADMWEANGEAERTDINE